MIDLLTRSVTFTSTKAKGGSGTFVMVMIAEDSPRVSTMNNGDSVVWLVRKDRQGNPKTLFKSKSDGVNHLGVV